MKVIPGSDTKFKIREVLKEINKETEDHFDELKESVVETLDISDLGNMVGIVIARHFDEGNTRDDFEAGIDHGISLTDGTHSCDRKDYYDRLKEDEDRLKEDV